MVIGWDSNSPTVPHEVHGEWWNFEVDLKISHHALSRIKKVGTFLIPPCSKELTRMSKLKENIANRKRYGRYDHRGHTR